MSRRVTTADRSSNLPPADPYVRAVLSALRDVITSQLDGWETGNDRPTVGEWVSADEVDVIAVDVPLVEPMFWLVARRLADLATGHDEVRVLGRSEGSSPRWQVLGELDGEAILVHGSLWFPAGTLGAHPVVAELDNERFMRPPVVKLQGHRRHAGALTVLAERIVNEAMSLDNPWRGRVLEVTDDSFRPTTLPLTSRADLVLPADVWHAVDTDIHGLLAKRARLAAAGLSTNRGLLLAGAPGVGKTALVQLIAREVVGTATVLLCDASSMSVSIDDVYATAARLAPSVVVLDDLDLAAPHRDLGHNPRGLHELLTNLDGAMTAHDDVITIATTNEPRRLDPALVRACRFDRVITVPHPDGDGRRQLLARLLDRLGTPADGAELADLADRTDGATGADLTALVRLAVLAADGEHVTVQDLHAAAQGGEWRQPSPTGSYL